MADMPKKADVLVVDDQPINLRLLNTILSERGYSVRVVTSGEEALMVIRDAIPDLILLDVMMPGMSGYDVCRELKASPEFRHIPVVFITALNSELDISQVFQAGAAGYINKPFRLNEILEKLNQHLGNREDE